MCKPVHQTIFIGAAKQWSLLRYARYYHIIVLVTIQASQGENQQHSTIRYSGCCFLVLCRGIRTCFVRVHTSDWWEDIGPTSWRQLGLTNFTYRGMASDGLEVQEKAEPKPSRHTSQLQRDALLRSKRCKRGTVPKLGKVPKNKTVSNVNIMSKMWAESSLWLTNIYCSVVDGRFSTYIVREFDKSSGVIFRQRSCCDISCQVCLSTYARRPSTNQNPPLLDTPF